MTILSPSELPCDTGCAVRRSGDGEPLTGLGILDGVTLLDLGERHLLCSMFGTHCPSPGSSRKVGDRLVDSRATHTRQSKICRRWPQNSQICDPVTFVVTRTMAAPAPDRRTVVRLLKRPSPLQALRTIRPCRWPKVRFSPVTRSSECWALVAWARCSAGLSANRGSPGRSRRCVPSDCIRRDYTARRDGDRGAGSKP
jgi:hypothetical protein